MVRKAAASNEPFILPISNDQPDEGEREMKRSPSVRSVKDECQILFALHVSRPNGPLDQNHA